MMGPVHLALKAKILDPSYPCYFATTAARTGQLRYASFPNCKPKIAADHLRHFVRNLNSVKGCNRSALVLTEDDSPLGEHMDYFLRFWALLQAIHQLDEASWPACRPIDPLSADWMYVFHNQPFFVLGFAPSFALTSGRYNVDGLCCAFVPQQAFLGIERNTKRGAEVRADITRRQREYEGRDSPRCLEQKTQKALAWPAYFPFEDGNVTRPCPFAVKRVSRGQRVFLPVATTGLGLSKVQHLHRP